MRIQSQHQLFSLFHQYNQPFQLLFNLFKVSLFKIDKLNLTEAKDNQLSQAAKKKVSKSHKMDRMLEITQLKK